MALTSRSWFLPAGAIFVIILVGIAAAITHPITTISSETSARDIVAAFGASEKNVVLYGTLDDARRNIELNYAQLVTAELLQQWTTMPSTAPGRSAPDVWPDRIVLEKISRQGAGYIVLGHVVVRDNDPVRVTPVYEIPAVIFLAQENGSWRIAAYQEQATSTPE